MFLLAHEDPRNDEKILALEDPCNDQEILAQEDPRKGGSSQRRILAKEDPLKDPPKNHCRNSSDHPYYREKRRISCHMLVSAGRLKLRPAAKLSWRVDNTIDYQCEEDPVEEPTSAQFTVALKRHHLREPPPDTDALSRKGSSDLNSLSTCSDDPANRSTSTRESSDDEDGQDVRGRLRNFNLDNLDENSDMNEFFFSMPPRRSKAAVSHSEEARVNEVLIESSLTISISLSHSLSHSFSLFLCVPLSPYLSFSFSFPLPLSLAISLFFSLPLDLSLSLFLSIFQNE